MVDSTKVIKNKDKDMQNTFNIQLTQDFKNYLNSLSISKKAIINSKLSFLKNTGLLGNCKVLGNNIFELENIKIFCLIENNVVIVSHNLELLNKLEKCDTMVKLSWLEYNRELILDLKYAKSFYDKIYVLYKQTDEEAFFLSELKSIAEIQGKDNFKKITGFSYEYIDNTNSDIVTLNNLKAKLNFLIKLKSVDYIVEKTKIKQEEIEKILKLKEDLNLDNLQKLIKFLSK